MDIKQIRTKLRQILDEKNVSMRAASLRAGLQHNAVSNIMNRNQGVSYGSLEKILRALDVPFVDFWEPGEGANAPPPISPPAAMSMAPLPAAATVFVPNCGTVAAGPFRMCDPDTTQNFLAGSREDEGAFVLNIRGDSMTPDYTDGETIFLRRENIHLIALPRDVKVGVPYERVKHLNGKDCVLLMKDEGSTFKRLRIEKGRGPEYTVTLLPVNPTHNKTVVRPDHDVWIQGVCYKSVRRR